MQLHSTVSPVLAILLSFTAGGLSSILADVQVFHGDQKAGTTNKNADRGTKKKTRGTAVSKHENQPPAVAIKPAVDALKQVPDSWRKVLDAQKGEIVKLVAKDSYLVWLERRLIERTRRFRAQAFDYFLYRTLAESPKATLIHTIAGTKLPHFVVGLKGVVVVHETHGIRQVSRLLRPGKLTRLIEYKNTDGYADLPLSIFEHGWLCRSKDGITWIPAKAWNPKHRRRVMIVPWKKVIKSRLELYNSKMFSNQGFVCFTKRLLKKNGNPGKPLGVVWTMRTKTELFTVPGYPLGIDKDFVFLAPHDPMYLVGKVRRKKLERGAPLEELRLPHDVVQLIEFDAGVLVGLCKRDNKGFFVARFDLSRRKMTEYRGRLPGRFVSTAADCKKDAVYAATAKAIYKLSPLKVTELSEISRLEANSANGKVTVAEQLDYEQKNIYFITVKATDPAGNAGTATLSVFLNDAPDAPVFTGAGILSATVSVVETDPIGTPDYTVTARWLGS
ncbi:MAG: cadherin repeat domain-containing protein [Planctomycetes bacterium]|nr:cadherin repeat domain-containing protein [Planctomycetota bacterium]